MLRLVLRLNLFLFMVLVVYLAVVRLRPYTYPTGFTMLVPDLTCETPCVLGVMPGHTTSTEAIQILSSHPMVTHVRQDKRTDGSGEIMWNWQPEYAKLKPVGLNIMWHDGDGVILGVSIPTTVPLSEYRILLGLPDHVQYSRYPNSGDVAVREVYGDVYLTYSFRCVQRSEPRLYNQPITLLVNPRGVRFQFDKELRPYNIMYTDPCNL